MSRTSGRAWPARLTHGEITLRPLAASDQKAWRSARERNAAWLVPWDATVPPGGEARPTTFRSLVRRLNAMARAGTTYPFALEVSGRFAGQVTVNNIVRGSAQFASVGYWLDRDFAGLTASFRRLFGHTARGPVSPYETEYGQDALFQQSQEMSDLGGFLRAFGLTLRAEAHERIDHVSCECEFMAFLSRKDAYATERGDGGMAEASRQASRLFLRDHLGRFGPAFARKLTREDRGGFYGILGALCLAFLSAECDRLRVTPGSEFVELRDVDLDDAPMACGNGSELLNIEAPDDNAE